MAEPNLATIVEAISDMSSEAVESGVELTGERVEAASFVPPHRFGADAAAARTAVTVHLAKSKNPSGRLVG